MMVMIRDEPPALSTALDQPAQRASLRSVLVDGNVLRCVVLSIAYIAYLVLSWAFLPLYLVNVRHYEASTMSWVMGVVGIAATLYALLIPALSDRIGRRPVMIIVPVLSLVLPVAALLYSGPVWGLTALFCVGWTFTGIMPLFMAAIPSESVDARSVSTVLGLCMGGSEILGGVLAPALGGIAADHFGLEAPLWGLLACALTGTLAALGLRETAPRIVTKTVAT
jgi:predicted MFS family arabinose efflux permease